MATKKHILVFLFLIFFVLVNGLVHAQHHIKGQVVDSVQKEVMENLTVSLLLAADTSLISFQRVKSNSSFDFYNVPNGRYIIMITHPFYADYVSHIQIEKNIQYNAYLTPLSTLLEEIIVKNAAAIRVKGDTTFYKVDSFKFDKNASVEDLLKRLPGLQVDMNGSITAFGEKVKRVLVDGEEFFGSDPGIATKNLRADIVEDVQVYKAKSEKALFTGVDDGVRTNTINLKLKENKKKGYFGKVELGGGYKNKYYTSATINSFSGKRKASVYGSTSNIGYSHSSDINKLNSMSILGTPTNYTWGGQYTNKFLKDALTLNGNYKGATISTPGETKTLSKILVQDSSWNSNTTSKYKTRSTSHATDFFLEFNPSKKDNVKFSSQLGISDSYSNAIYNVLNTYSEDDSKKISENLRSSIDKTNRSTATNELRWQHKLKKPTQLFLLSLKHQYTKNISSDYLNSKLDIYLNNLINKSISFDQLNKTHLQTNYYPKQQLY